MADKEILNEFIDKENIEKEIKEYQDKGIKLQKFIQEGKELPYAQRRLLTEEFNIIASQIDCLAALLSIL